MGGGEVIDIRRADLMRRLEQREIPELRFLLGYLEYHTGDREHGLANLEQAAREDRAGSIISRYPALLRGGGTSPAPQAPGERPGQPGRMPAGARGAASQPAGAAEEETLIVPPIPPAPAEPKEPAARDRP
jgi:hypothetical protein